MSFAKGSKSSGLALRATVFSMATIIMSLGYLHRRQKENKTKRKFQTIQFRAAYGYNTCLYPAT